MVIRNIGNSLAHIMPELAGQQICRVFDLLRPLVKFEFVSVSGAIDISFKTLERRSVESINEQQQLMQRPNN